MDVVSKILVFGVKYLTEIATQTVISSCKKSGLNKINPVFDKRNDDIRERGNHAHKQTKPYNVIDEQFKNIEREIKNGAITSPQGKDKLAKNIDQPKVNRILKSKDDKIDKERSETHFKHRHSDHNVRSILSQTHSNVEKLNQDQENKKNTKRINKLNATGEEHDKYAMEMIVKLSKSNLKKHIEDNRDLKMRSNSNMPVDESRKTILNELDGLDEQTKTISKSDHQLKPSWLKEHEKVNQTTNNLIAKSKPTFEAQSTSSLSEHKKENTGTSNIDLTPKVSEDYNLDIIVKIKHKYNEKQPKATDKPQNSFEQPHPSLLCGVEKPAPKISEKVSVNASKPIDSSKCTIITPLATVTSVDKSKKSEKGSVPLDPSKFTIITSVPTLSTVEILKEKTQKSDELWESTKDGGHSLKKTVENEEQRKNNPTIFPITTPASSQINLTESDTMVKQLSKCIDEGTKHISEYSPKLKSKPQLIKNIEEIMTTKYNKSSKEDSQSMPNLLRNHDIKTPECEKLYSKNITDVDKKMFPKNRINQVKSLFQDPVAFAKENSSCINVILETKLIDQKILELRSKKLNKNKDDIVKSSQQDKQIKKVEPTVSQNLKDTVIYHLDETLSTPNFKQKETVETKSIQDLKSHFQTAKKLDEGPENKDGILFKLKSDLFKKYSNTEFNEKQLVDKLTKMESQLSCMIKNLEQFNLFETNLPGSNLKEKIAEASKLNKQDTPRILKITEEFKQFETNLFVGKMKSIIGKIRKQQPSMLPRTNKMLSFDEFETKVLTDKFKEIMDKTKEEPINILNNFDATKVKELLYEEYLNEKLRYINQDAYGLQQTEEEFNTQQIPDNPKFRLKSQNLENKFPNNYVRNENKRKENSKQAANNSSNKYNKSEDQRKQDSKRLMNDLEAFFEFEKSLGKEENENNSKDVNCSIQNEHNKIEQDALQLLTNQKHFKKIANKILNANTEKENVTHHNKIYTTTKSKDKKSSAEDNSASRINEAGPSIKESVPIKCKQIKTKNHNILKSEERITKDVLEELKDVLDQNKKADYALQQLETKLSPGLNLFNTSKSHKSDHEDSSDSKMNNIEKDISTLLTNKEIFKKAKNKPLPNELNEILDNIKQESIQMKNVEEPVKESNEINKAEQLIKNNLSNKAVKTIEKSKKQELKHKSDAFAKPETSLSKETLTDKVDSKLNQLKVMYYKRQKETENNFNSVPKQNKQNNQTYNQATNRVEANVLTNSRKFNEILNNNKLKVSKESLNKVENLNNKYKSEKTINQPIDLQPNTPQKDKINLQKKSENTVKSSNIKEAETIKQLETPAIKFVGFRAEKSKESSNILDALTKSGLIQINNKSDKQKNPDSDTKEKEQKFEPAEIKESNVNQHLYNENKLRKPLSNENHEKTKLKSNLIRTKRNKFRANENNDQKNLGKIEDMREVLNTNLKESNNRNNRLKPLDEFSKIERTFTKVKLDSNSEQIDVDVTPRLNNKQNKRSSPGDSLKEVFKIYKYELSKNHKEGTPYKLEDVILSQIENNGQPESSKLKQEIQNNEHIALVGKLKEIKNKRREDSKLLLNNFNYFKAFEKLLHSKLKEEILQNENIPLANKLKEIENKRREESKRLLTNIDCFKKIDKASSQNVLNSKLEFIEQDASHSETNLTTYNDMQERIADKLLNQTIKNLMKQVRSDRMKLEKNYEIFKNVEKNISYAVVNNKLKQIEVKRKDESKHLLNNFDCFKKFEELLRRKVFNAKFELIEQEASRLQVNLEQFNYIEQNIASNYFKETIANLAEQVRIDRKKMQTNYETFEKVEEILSKIAETNRLKEFNNKRVAESKRLINNIDCFDKFEKLLNEKVNKSKLKFIEEDAILLDINLATYSNLEQKLANNFLKNAITNAMKQVSSDKKTLEKNYETLQNFEAELKQKELIEGFEKIISDSTSTYKNDVAFRKLENKIKEQSFLKTVAKKRLEHLLENSRSPRGNVEQSLLKKVQVSAELEFKLNEQLFWDEIKAIDVDNFYRENFQIFQKEKEPAHLEESRMENSCNTKIMDSFTLPKKRTPAQSLTPNNLPYIFLSKNVAPNLEDRIKGTEEDIREKSKLIKVNNSVFENTERIMNMVKIITPNVQTEKKRKEEKSNEIDYVKKQQGAENNTNLLTKRIDTGSISNTKSLIISKSSLGLNKQMLIHNLPLGMVRQTRQLDQHYFINNMYVQSNFLTANKFAFNSTDSQNKVTTSEQIENCSRALEHKKVCFIHNTKQEEVTSNHRSFKDSLKFIICTDTNSMDIPDEKKLLHNAIKKEEKKITDKSVMQQNEMSFKVHILSEVMDIPNPSSPKQFICEKNTFNIGETGSTKQEENVITDKSIMNQKEITLQQENFEEELLKLHNHSNIKEIADTASSSQCTTVQAKNVPIINKQQDAKLSEDVGNKNDGTATKKYDNTNINAKSTIEVRGENIAIHPQNKDLLSEVNYIRSKDNELAELNKEKNSEKLSKFNIKKIITEEFALKNLEDKINKESIDQQLLFGANKYFAKYINENKNTQKENTTTGSIANITKLNQGSEEARIKPDSQMIYKTDRLNEANADREKTESLYKKIFTQKDKPFTKEYKHETDIISDLANDFYIESLNKRPPQKNKTSEKQQNEPSEPQVYVKLPFKYSKAIHAKLIKPTIERSTINSALESRKEGKAVQISKQRPLGHHMKIKRMKIQAIRDKKDRILKTREQLKTNTYNETKAIDAESPVQNMSKQDCLECTIQERNKEDIPENIEDMKVYVNPKNSAVKQKEIENVEKSIKKSIKVLLHTITKDISNFSSNQNQILFEKSAIHKKQSCAIKQEENNKTIIKQKEESPKELIRVLIHPELTDIADPTCSLKEKQILFEKPAFPEEQTAEEKENVALTDKTITKQKEITFNQENIKENMKEVIKVPNDSELKHIPDPTSTPREQQPILLEENALSKQQTCTTNEKENVVFTDKLIINKNDETSHKMHPKKLIKVHMHSELSDISDPTTEQKLIIKRQDELSKQEVMNKENKCVAVMNEELQDTLETVNQLKSKELKDNKEQNSEELCKNKDNIGEVRSKKYDEENKMKDELEEYEINDDIGINVACSKIQKEDITSDNIRNMISVKEIAACTKLVTEATKKLEKLLNRTVINKHKGMRKKYTHEDNKQFLQEYKHGTDIISEFANNFAIESLNKQTARKNKETFKLPLGVKIKSTAFKFPFMKTERQNVISKNKNKITAPDSINSNKETEKTSQLSKLRPLGHNMKITRMKIPTIIVEEDDSFAASDKIEKPKVSKNLEMKIPIVDDNCIIRNLSKLRPFGHGVNIWKTNGILYMQPYPEIGPSGILDILNDCDNIQCMRCKQGDSNLEKRHFPITDKFSILKGYIDRQISKFSKKIPKIRPNKPKTKRKQTKQEKKPKSLNFKSQYKWNTKTTKDLEVALASYKNKYKKQNDMWNTKSKTDLEAGANNKNKNQKEKSANIRFTLGTVANDTNLIAKKSLKRQKQNVDSSKNRVKTKPHMEKLLNNNFKISLHNEYHIKQQMNQPNEEIFCKFTQAFRDAQRRRNVKNIEDVIARIKKMKLIRENLSVSHGNNSSVMEAIENKIR